MTQNVVMLQFETIFNPTTEAMRVVRKNNRKKEVGSLNTSIPISAVPAAPIPVHTA